MVFPRTTFERPDHDASGIFLDNQATTQLDPRVLAAMLPYYGERYGNAHSSGYVRAEAARMATEQARASVAALLGATPADIVFTSGATESCDIAVRGSLTGPGCRSVAGRLVYSAIEHECVRRSARALRADGVETVEVPVDEDGMVDLDEVDEALREGAAVATVMLANNEVGTIQPVEEIATLCRSRGCLFHTDAAQAAGKVPIDVSRAGIDLLSLSGHKLHGPQGIGALYCSREARDRLRRNIGDGGQEGGLRPGTLPLALCVGLGEACRIASDEMATEAVRVADLRDRLLALLGDGIPDLAVNGGLDRRLPGNLNVSFPGVDGEALVRSLRDVAISTGSACASGALAPSHVLLALGVGPSRAETAIRIGLGRFTTEAEVTAAAARIIAMARSLAA